MIRETEQYIWELSSEMNKLAVAGTNSIHLAIKSNESLLSSTEREFINIYLCNVLINLEILLYLIFETASILKDKQASRETSDIWGKWSMYHLSSLFDPLVEVNPLLSTKVLKDKISNLSELRKIAQEEGEGDAKLVDRIHAVYVYYFLAHSRNNINYQTPGCSLL